MKVAVSVITAFIVIVVGFLLPEQLPVTVACKSTNVLNSSKHSDFNI